MDHGEFAHVHLRCVTVFCVVSIVGKTLLVIVSMMGRTQKMETGKYQPRVAATSVTPSL